MATPVTSDPLAIGCVLPGVADGLPRSVPRRRGIALGPVALELRLHFTPGAAAVLGLNAHLVAIAVDGLGIPPAVAAGAIPLLPPLAVARTGLLPTRATGTGHIHVAVALNPGLFAANCARDVLGVLYLALTKSHLLIHARALLELDTVLVEGSLA